jgi:hypothetical protein
MPRLLTTALAVILIAACSGPQLADDPLPESQQPSASAEPTDEPGEEPTPTPEPTPRPTEAPAADLARVHQVVYAWTQEFSDFISYQVIISIVNEGSGWAEVSAFDSDYQVLDANGGLVTTGFFTYAYPAFLGPGETGYLIGEGFEEGLDPASFVTVEADGRYEEADGPDVTFTFTDVQLIKEEFDAGYTANGFMTADAEVTDAAVAVVCLDAEGTPLGATWTNLVQNLSPGEPKGFETIGSSPPLDPSLCAQLVALAQDTGF